MNTNNTGTTNFSDIVKKSILDNFASDISISKIIITLGVSFLIGLFIYILYRRVFSGVLYSKSFNVSLIGMTMVTAMVIIAVNSNLVLSLGMVGALSIVRFRTPIKDPTDLIFLFWAAAAGIVAGAGFYTLAALGSAIVGLILFLFIKSSSLETPYLLVVNCENDESEQLHPHADGQSGETVQCEAKKRDSRQHRNHVGGAPARPGREVHQPDLRAWRGQKCRLNQL